MITKITPETTVKEICEVLAELNKSDEFLLSHYVKMYFDGSGTIYDKHNRELCTIKELPKYLKENKPEKDYDAILSDPAAVKKILSKLPIKDILSEISGRFEI